jgi:hypothetical protein
MEWVVIIFMIVVLCLVFAIVISNKREKETKAGLVTLDRDTHYPGKMESHIETVVDIYNPDVGIVGGWWERKKAEKRIKLQEVLNTEAKLVTEGLKTKTDADRIRVEHQTMIPKAQMELERLAAEHKLSLLSVEARAEVKRLATQAGVDDVTYLMGHQKQDEADIGIHVYRETKRTDVKTARDMKQVETEARGTGFQQDEDAAHSVKLVERNLIKKLTKELYELYEEAEEIRNSDAPESVKQRKLLRVEKNIQALEREVDERQGFISSDSGGETGEGSESSDARGVH